ncbi:MAG: DUF11 domain-containing protein, partial [Anaerolineae bacterium]|nr:DUF11 domain-containing protein [Anaerolineae bacterium]
EVKYVSAEGRVAPVAAGSTLTWALGTLEAGASETITVVVEVESWASGLITNTALLTADTTDPALPNEGTWAVYVGVAADLQLTKSGDPADTTIAGTVLTYTLQVRNAGSSDAEDVTLTDQLPEEVTFLSATGPVSPTLVGSELEWALGTLVNGAAQTYVVVVEVHSDASGWITNSASVWSPTTLDPIAGNDVDDVVTWVDTRADLRIAKNAAPEPVAAGANLLYTLSYANDGPSDAQNVCITDTLPTGVSFAGDAGQPDGWVGPVADAGPPATLTWCRSALAAGASDTITFAVTVLPGTGSLVNSVAIGSQTTDPNVENNTPPPTWSTISCCADAYEPDDVYTDAAALLPGVPQLHNFADDSADWLRFTAQRGQIYTVTTSAWGQRADTVLDLVEPDGRTVIASNDDYEGTDNYSSRIVWQAPRDGVYYVRVRNRAGLVNCYTEYDIWLQREERYWLFLPFLARTYAAAPANVGAQGIISHTCPDAYEVDDTWQTAGPIVPGVSQLHSFDSDPVYYAADKDFVWFELWAGQTITFTVTPVDPSVSVLLEIYDASGAALGVANAQGEGQLVWDPPTTGRAYLSVTPWPGEEVYGCGEAARYVLLAEPAPVWAVYLPIILRE